MKQIHVVGLWVVVACSLFAASAAVIVCVVCRGGGEVTVAASGGTLPADTNLIFLSDTQSPLLPELVLLSENRNREARELIFRDIHRERPTAVFHSGDLVSLGFCDRDWARVDMFVKRLTGEGIPFYPVLGNHEVMVFAREGEKRFQERYPYAVRTGYSARAGCVGVVMLNSNFDILTGPEILRQQRWYDSTLVSMEADSTVKAVIVMCHHSPFTNSSIVSPSAEVRRRFVPLFVRNEKCKLFISGHAHAFEHFVQQGKNFFVIGGGGALQQPLYKEDERKWKDSYSDRREKRMFHYAQCSVYEDSLRITVRMVGDKFSSFREAYALSVGL
jgi:3',5'-cyclic AMP phosphodiesterase CpdA